LEVLILNDFKSLSPELVILNGLKWRFSELVILKELRAKNDVAPPVGGSFLRGPLSPGFGAASDGMCSRVMQKGSTFIAHLSMITSGLFE
jgi:hypothetical protein